MKSPGMARLFCLSVVVLVLALSKGLNAQAGPNGGLTLADLKSHLKQAQSETELDPKVKQEVIELYESAIQRFELADEAVVATKRFQSKLDSVADDLQQAKLKLASIPESSGFSVPADADVDGLERKLEERRHQIDAPDHGLRAKLDAITKEMASRKPRVEEIASDLIEVEERLEAIQQQFDAIVPPDEPRELTLARQSLLLVRRMRAVEERTALMAEQDWCVSDDAAGLLRAHHDLAAKELAIAEAEAQLLQREIDNRRDSEANRRIRIADDAITNASASARPIAQSNRNLAVETREVATILHETNQRVDSAREKFTVLKAEFDQSTKMVDAVGLTESIGLLLRQQRTKLRDTRGLHSRLVLRGESVRQTKMRLFEIEAEIAALNDLEAASLLASRELMNDEATPATNEKANSSVTPEVRRLADEIKPLLEKKRELLERLDADYNTLFEKLVLLDNDERRLLDATRKYSDYIDERVLWIRTGTAFGGTQIARATTSGKWLVDPVNWMKVVDALNINLLREPLPYAFAMTALICWVGLWWTMHRRLQQLGSLASEESCHDLSPTIQAIVLTMASSAFVPSILAFVGWRLDHCASTSKFAHAAGMALLRMACFSAPLELLRRLVSHGGLAEKHFDWSGNTISRLRWNLRWFVPVGIMLIGVIGLLEAYADEQRNDSLGRLAYLVFASLLVLFSIRGLPRSMRSAKEIAPSNHADRRSSDQWAQSTDSDVWITRLARLATIVAATVPLGLLILSWSGYFYTALQLTWRLQDSAWLAMGLTVVRGTIRRWITLERRRMAVLQAAELEAITGASQEPGTDGQPFLFPRWTWPDFRLNLTQIVSQVRSLLDTGLLTLAAMGLWLVWADVTPALNVLEKVELWHTTVEKAEYSKGPGDQQIVQMIKKPIPITAAHLGLAILVMGIAAVAGRNIPGLVEVILLEHLSVDAGARFATTCLVRYTIFIAGACLAFNQIGIGWNSVQWLVAAASVGLGFGLQEIFANFVSGIILLFERPMRVGDVITVGSTTGTVSKIRFRATTIVDGDRKELIVPNKLFITDNLLNWTLSDSINRIVIKVTVAYGAKPDRIRELLLRIASQHPSLVKDPAPTVILLELGGNALHFQLNAFLPNLKDREKTTHDLNAMIHDALREAEVQFPTDDQKIVIRMHEAESSAKKPHIDLHGSLESALLKAGVKI